MARDLLQINLELDRVRCHDEGDGWGNAEPYLWTVFFKVDGYTVWVTDSLTLGGEATIVTTPGSHGNLGDTDVDAGDTVTIPAAIGHWDTYLSPIRVPEPFNAFQEDVGGAIGVVAVLMEEDNVSDDGAEAGHQALNNAVRDAVNQIISTLSFTNQEISEEDISNFTGSIGSTVSNAIQNQQNFFENFWSWLNPDDTIGHHVWLFNHDDLAEGGTVEFSHRWHNEGDWEIFGHITSTPICPANALDGLFSGMSSMRMMTGTKSFSSRTIIDPQNIQKDTRRKLGIKPLDLAGKIKKEGNVFDLKAMREFRDGPYRNYPGLARWWELASRNTPGLVYELIKNRELRGPAWQLMKYASEAHKKPTSKVPDAQVRNMATLAAGLKKATRSRRLSIDCSRALSVLPLLKGKTVQQAMNILSKVQPAHHPVEDFRRRKRIPIPTPPILIPRPKKPAPPIKLPRRPKL